METGFGNMNNLINEIVEYATINNVPIMTESGIDFLTKYIRKNDVLKVLEIGTAKKIFRSN